MLELPTVVTKDKKVRVDLYGNTQNKYNNKKEKKIWLRK